MTLQTIKLYGANTPNVAKPYILLKLLDVPFETVYVNIKEGDQFKEDFIKLNPNSKIPVLVDPNVEAGQQPLVINESGNILIYLAKKYGKGKYLPDEKTHTQEHYEVLNWLFFQMSAIGPNFGNYNHYSNYAVEKIPYPIQRHLNEVKRLLAVLDRQLAKTSYSAGNELSIADIAIYPWFKYINLIKDIGQDEYPKVREYLARLAQLDAVKAYEKYDEETKIAHPPKPFTDEQRKVLFGRTN